MAKFFGLQRMWPIILYLSSYCQRSFFSFVTSSFLKEKDIFFLKKYIVNVWNYTICYMNLLEFARKFILLYQWTRNLLRGSTISWHLQTQQFLTSLILRAQSDLQLNTLVWHVLKVIVRLVFYNLATSIKSLYVFIIYIFSIIAYQMSWLKQKLINQYVKTFNNHILY